MRKQILAIAFGIATLTASAQKAELKAAEKAIKKQDFTTAVTAIKSAEPLIANADKKYKAKFYFLKAQAYAGTKNYEIAGKAYQQLFSYEKEIGKNRYTKNAQPMLEALIGDVSNKAFAAYSNEKDFKKASKYFYLTYVLRPKDTASMFNAAITSAQGKDFDSALKYYKKLKELGYTGIETQYLATNKETQKEENLGSKNNRDLMVKTGTYINPRDNVSKSKKALIIKNVALILKEQGKDEEALTAIDEARKANPKDVNLVLTAADIYSKMNKMDKFGELMDEATRLDPNNPILFYNLGVVNFNQGKVEDAKKYYKKCLSLDPKYRDAHMNMAVAVLAGEKKVVEEMNKNLSDFDKYDELAKKQKDIYKEALPYLQKADELKRTLDTVRTLMNIYETLEMTDKAKEYRGYFNKLRGK